MRHGPATGEHCSPDSPCSACFDAKHWAEHPEFVDGCFACKLDTIQVGAALHATRATNPARPCTPDNPWERGLVGQHRPGGTFMPYLDENHDRINTKKFAENRSVYEETLRRRAQTTNA